MGNRQRPAPRRECDKVGMCVDDSNEMILFCNQAPECTDYALPRAEELCMFRAESHRSEMVDPYKERYTKVCAELDLTLANPYLSDEHIETRFDAFERELSNMINSPELHVGDNGRYLFHIDARILHAALPGFYWRKLHGIHEAPPDEIIKQTWHGLADVLDDFDGLYKDVTWSVAFRRTEVEIGMFLLRAKRFPFPTTFREDSSLNSSFNHDWYEFDDQGNKVTIQVKNTDYRDRKKRGNHRISERYTDSMLVVIHQQVVNLDRRDDELIETVVYPKQIQSKEEEYDEPYAEFDPEHPNRYMVWGALSQEVEHVFADDPDEFRFIQKIQGKTRDGLVNALIKEARGEYLSTEEMNQLRMGSHFLIASIRENVLKSA